MSITYRWRGPVDNAALETLHAEGFDHAPTDYDWRSQLEDHSLGWVTAHQDGGLIGFANVIWDGATHAFVLDTLVAGAARRTGVGTRLVEIAVEEARAAGCEWLHVDFEDHLRGFYFESCGFEPTNAGLIAL
jgi:GNAT superfamily N-acetyltransferase